MAQDDLTTTLQRLRGKSGLLLERYRAMADARRRAEARVAQLTEELQKAHARIQALETELQYLHVASVLQPSREQVEQTRTLISDLVRDIDRCIGELT